MEKAKTSWFECIDISFLNDFMKRAYKTLFQDLLIDFRLKPDDRNHFLPPAKSKGKSKSVGNAKSHIKPHFLASRHKHLAKCYFQRPTQIFQHHREICKIQPECFLC